MAEHGGRVRADEVHQRAVLLGRRQPGQLRGERVAGFGAAGGRRLQGAARLGHVGEQGAGAGDGERADEPLPVEVRDGEGGLAVGQRLLERGDREGGPHGGQAAAAQHLLSVADTGHAALGPAAPGDGECGAPVCPPMLGEGVQVGVGRRVGTLAGAAPDAGARGEHDERVEFLTGQQFVQVRGTCGLGRHRAGEPGRVGVLDHDVVADAGGVDDGVDGVLGQQRPQGVTVGRVTGHDGRGRAELLQLRDELRGAGRRGAAAAGEHQVLRTRTGEPAGDVPAQRTRTTGDQHGAARRPPLGGAGGAGGPDEPAPEDARGADRHLVLGRLTEDGGHAGRGAGVQQLRKVEQSAPAPRVFQRRRPAEAPHLRLQRAVHAVGAAGGHRAARGAPQRDVDAHVAERLHQAEGRGEAVRQAGVAGRGALVLGEQGQHAGHRADAGQLAGQRPAVGAGSGDERHQFQAALVERGADRGGPLALAGHDEQPGPGRAGLRERAERLPGDAVAPAVDHGLLAALTAPCGQPGQDRAERGVRADAQGRGEGLRVLALHAVPEAGIRRVGRGAGSGQVPLPVQPEALALESVGGQGDAVSAGEQGLPVRGDAVHVQFGERGDDGLLLGAVTAQDGHGDGLVHAVLHHAAEDAAGADLHERGHAQLAEGLDAVGEAHRFAHVPDPVLRGVRLGQAPSEVGDHRDLRLMERQTADDLRELLQHRVHQRRVERVTDLQPGGLTALADEDLGDCGDRLASAGKHHGPRAVDRRDADLVGQVWQHFLLSGLDRDHRAADGQGLHQRGTRRHQPHGVVQRQHPGHMRGRDLTDRVTGHVIRPHTPRFEQPEQRHLDREERGLSAPRSMQGLGVDVDRRLQTRTHLVVRIGEDRERLIQLTPHTDPLRTLTREQKTDLALGAGSSQRHVRRRLTGGEGGEGLPELVRALCQEHRAVLERLAGGQ
ncbi:hypothetical protein Save01_06445 [Streptomyces avermitilis]